MSTNSQAQAKALNAKIESEATAVIGELERSTVRLVHQRSYQCIADCYANAGKTWENDRLQQCGNQCQAPMQQANQILQGEVQQFQSRLNRSMMECQDKARDHMVPGMENDEAKMAEMEKTMLKCMGSTVDTHIGLLKPMKQRIESQLQQVMPQAGGQAQEKKKGWW